MAQLKSLLCLLRPIQWVKNGVVFAPLVFSGRFVDAQAVAWCLFTFAEFCFASSLVYILNDIVDREADRLHPRKSQTRPLASGALTLREAYLLGGLCAAMAVLLSAVTASSVAWIVASYVVINIYYTFVGKHQPIVDLFLIASGFMLRVFAGALAIQVPVSNWMFLTMFCAALCLASIKRVGELRNSTAEGRAVLRHYTISLLEKYSAFAAVGALMSYCFFVVTIRANLVFTVPIVFFIFFRYWYLAEQKDQAESPTELLVKDPLMLCSFVIWTAICAIVIAHNQ